MRKRDCSRLFFQSEVRKLTAQAFLPFLVPYTSFIRLANWTGVYSPGHKTWPYIQAIYDISACCLGLLPIGDMIPCPHVFRINFFSIFIPPFFSARLYIPCNYFYSRPCAARYNPCQSRHGLLNYFVRHGRFHCIHRH